MTYASPRFHRAARPALALAVALLCTVAAPASTRRPPAVVVTAVSDYAPGRYTGKLEPSPPHADGNPGRAVIISWPGRAERFVFSHEASYCPLFELPSGAAMANQFFEGNLGEAELMNQFGRRERNSFVDVMESRPDRAWVRWTYFAVNQNDDTVPRLRGTEDYFAFPNGLVLRKASYTSLLPDQPIGYSTQPVELFGVAPVGASLADLFTRDPAHGDYRVLAAVDLYGEGRYEIYWSDDGAVRRVGDDATLAAISRSRGFALVLPFRDRLMFAVLGEASGFPAGNSQLIDHSTPGAEGGAGWGVGRWDHWPIGWLNSQAHNWKPGSPYPWSFGSIGHFLVPEGQRIREFWKDYSALCEDKAFNRWTEQRVFGVLMGHARDWRDVHRIGRAWLDQGAACLQPDTVARLPESREP
ncbi:MAG: hypothetical protein H7A44_02605 [Opitutaceae bacterium]|nr:hypothetical protein [Cephaloticoccus sp.]MCP5529307.1 hypothetical protein [Opitutaceae bacterium]